MVADISAVHQSRRPHRTQYPGGQPWKHANSPGRRSASPAGSRQTQPLGWVWAGIGACDPRRVARETVLRHRVWTSRVGQNGR